MDPNDNGQNPNNNGVAGNADNGPAGDPDGDGFTNAQEYNGGVKSSDPRNGQSIPGDIDGDRLSDAWEESNFSGSLAQGPFDDPEGDGVPHLLEFAFGLNPLVSDGGPLKADVG